MRETTERNDREKRQREKTEREKTKTFVLTNGRQGGGWRVLVLAKVRLPSGAESATKEAGRSPQNQYAWGRVGHSSAAAERGGGQPDELFSRIIFSELWAFRKNPSGFFPFHFFFLLFLFYIKKLEIRSLFSFSFSFSISFRFLGLALKPAATKPRDLPIVEAVVHQEKDPSKPL